jgi:signal transduction histidine kinase
LGLATAHWAAATAQRQCIERGRGIAETLQRSSFPLTESVLRQLRGLGGAEFVLVDPGGRLGFGTLEGWDGTRANRRASFPTALAIDNVSDLSFDQVLSHGGVVYRVAVVARPSPAPEPRRVMILLPEPTLRAAAWEARRTVLAWTAAGATLAILLACGIGQSLSRPLSAILNVVRRIGHGELDPRGLPRDRRDEIGELAEGVTQMAAWLQRLREEQAQTERLRLIRQVSAGLAHELRNPLTAARMTLQLALERDPGRDPEPLRIALAELGRMERQVRRFLQIARPEPPRFQIVAIGTVLDRCAANLAASAAHQGITLSVELDEALPAARVDLDQTFQIIINITMNAIDAAGPGGRVRLVGRRLAGNFVAIDVEDDGPGVKAGDEPRLFQPFFTTKPEGVGLGLALCAALVREQGGAIGYCRRTGWTRFRVTLPAVEPRAEGSPEKTSGQEPSGHEASPEPLPVG